MYLINEYFKKVRLKIVKEILKRMQKIPIVFYLKYTHKISLKFLFLNLNNFYRPPIATILINVIVKNYNC